MAVYYVKCRPGSFAKHVRVACEHKSIARQIDMEANKIIDRLGGTNKTAELCDVKPPSVSQWRQFGIPHARLMYLRLARPEVFDDDEREEQSLKSAD